MLDTLIHYSREEWRSNANWKTMLENYLECYHCAVAHPGFNAAIDVRPDVYTLAVTRLFLEPERPGAACRARGQEQDRTLRRRAVRSRSRSTTSCGRT